ncbi:LysR substrate-binding domain-containing protein [Thalassobaculum sp.]|uniref:LysR substrate-binding domain-containing protein n=1 Tax=Thalassobaculum sp. TaxID=2022740 RepID=UPI0032EB48B9
MRRLPSLGALRAFEAAARHQSFKQAAAELGVTPTAISHQVRQLEEYLRVALFRRQVRRVVLTPEGDALYPVLQRVFDTIAESVDALRRRPVRRVATLSATVAFTARLLVPHVAAFRVLHPDWDLRLHASDDPVDLHAGEADAAIRYGPGRYPGLTAMPVITDRFLPTCSPHLGLTRPQDLAGSVLIHFEWRAAGPESTRPNWRAWARRAGVEGFDAASGITFSDESSAIQATIAGQGVALLSSALVAGELASGALVQPFGPALDGSHYDLVFPIDAEDRPPVAALRRWVASVLIPRLASAPQASPR